MLFTSMPLLRTDLNNISSTSMLVISRRFWSKIQTAFCWEEYYLFPMIGRCRIQYSTPSSAVDQVQYGIIVRDLSNLEVSDFITGRFASLNWMHWEIALKILVDSYVYVLISSVYLHEVIGSSNKLLMRKDLVRMHSAPTIRRSFNYKLPVWQRKQDSKWSMSFRLWFQLGPLHCSRFGEHHQ